MKKTFTLLAIALVTTVSHICNAQLIENFESTTGTGLPAGWTQNVIPTDSTGWLSGSYVALASALMPMGPHTRFVAVNDCKYLHGHNQNALLRSPLFNIPASMGHPYLYFDYFFEKNSLFYLSDTIESATVELSTNGGLTWTVLDSLPASTFSIWGPHFVDLAGHSGTGLMLGFRYSDIGTRMTGLAVDNIKVYDASLPDAAVVSVTPVAGSPSSYGLAGDTITLQATVCNYGLTTAHVTAGFSFNGTVVNNPYIFYIPTRNTGVVGVALNAILPPALGGHQAKLWIRYVGDTDPLNDTFATTLTTVAHLPQKQIFFEEPTGTWCGWCPRGIVYMDSAWQLQSDKINIVAIHDDTMNRENLAVRNYDRWLYTKDVAFPHLYPDRTTFNADPVNVFNYINKLKDGFAFADMSITTRVSDTAGGIARATVNVTPAINMVGDHRLAIILTQDSVHGSGFDWEQNNMFSGGSPTMSWGPYNFNTLPWYIPSDLMYYDFVARYTLPDMLASQNGIAGSLPSTMVAGTTYSYTSVTIPVGPTWIWHRMRAIAILIDNDPESVTYGQVLNSTRCSLTLDTTLNTDGVTNMNTTPTAVSVFPNPAREETNIAFNLPQPSDVSLQIYDAIGRPVYTVAYSNMNQGTHRLTVPIAAMAPGIYNIIITTASEKINRVFSVIR